MGPRIPEEGSGKRPRATTPPNSTRSNIEGGDEPQATRRRTDPAPSQGTELRTPLFGREIGSPNATPLPGQLAFNIPDSFRSSFELLEQLSSHSSDDLDLELGSSTASIPPSELISSLNSIGTAFAQLEFEKTEDAFLSHVLRSYINLANQLSNRGSRTRTSDQHQVLEKLPLDNEQIQTLILENNSLNNSNEILNAIAPRLHQPELQNQLLRVISHRLPYDQIPILHSVLPNVSDPNLQLDYLNSIQAVVTSQRELSDLLSPFLARIDLDTPVLYKAFLILYRKGQTANEKPSFNPSLFSNDRISALLRHIHSVPTNTEQTLFYRCLFDHLDSLAKISNTSEIPATVLTDVFMNILENSQLTPDQKIELIETNFTKENLTAIFQLAVTNDDTKRKALIVFHLSDFIVIFPDEEQPVICDRICDVFISCLSHNLSQSEVRFLHAKMNQMILEFMDNNISQISAEKFIQLLTPLLQLNSNVDKVLLPFTLLLEKKFSDQENGDVTIRQNLASLFTGTELPADYLVNVFDNIVLNTELSENTHYSLLLLWAKKAVNCPDEKYSEYITHIREHPARLSLITEILPNLPSSQLEVAFNIIQEEFHNDDPNGKMNALAATALRMEDFDFLVRVYNQSLPLLIQNRLNSSESSIAARRNLCVAISQMTQAHLNKNPQPSPQQANQLNEMRNTVNRYVPTRLATGN